MTERLTLRLWNPQQGHQQLMKAWEMAKAMLIAGHRMVLELRPETGSDAQNRLIHALFGDVARQKEWMGKRLRPDQWKVLFVSGHAVASREGAEVIPGLEGEFVNIRESTAQMSKARRSSLIEYTLAWCAQNNVELREARQWVDPDTGEILEARA